MSTLGASEINSTISSDLDRFNGEASAGEIEEEINSVEVNGAHSYGEDNCAYVGIGSEESASMDALLWTLANADAFSISTVCLVHVFPETHFIPSPLGKIPKSRISPEQLEIFMAQERRKRRDHLQKFLDRCAVSKVKTDTVLIESDAVAKSFLELMTIMNMKKLVIGIDKSTVKKLKSKREDGLVSEIVKHAPPQCVINIIWGGKEVKLEETNPETTPDLVQTSSCLCFCNKQPRVM